MIVMPQLSASGGSRASSAAPAISMPLPTPLSGNVVPTSNGVKATDTTVSLSPDLKFDEKKRTSQSDQPVPAGGAMKALKESAEMSGLDVQPELYNEALRFAAEGHYRQAKDRVAVLLALDTNDSDARLLLAKLHVAGQRWQEALSALDEAQQCGAHVPMALRKAVEEHLRSEAAALQEQESALSAREQGEVKALRTEARRLRSENAQLLGRSHDLERETRKWAWTTATVSGVGLLLVGLNVLITAFSSDGATEPTVADAIAMPDQGSAAAADVAPGAASVAAAVVAPPTTGAIADQAKSALASADGLDDTELKVVVRGDKAAVSGTVLTAKQKAKAKSVLSAVKGVSGVDVSGVSVLARTKGTEHVVGKGDTLSKIAVQYYGDGNLAGKIQKANASSLKGGTGLSIGQKLQLPPVE